MYRPNEYSACIAAICLVAGENYTMATKTLLCGTLLLFVLTVGGVPSLKACRHDTVKNQDTFDSRPGHQLASVMQGTWSGSFFSSQSDASAFTMTVLINRDSRGHLVADSNLSSNCFRGAKLQVTRSGSDIILSGHNEEGHTIVIRGTLDSTGSLLQASYMLHGGGERCETDEGTGNLGKR